jgi:sugar phosphate isomerase/epimerase
MQTGVEYHVAMLRREIIKGMGLAAVATAIPARAATNGMYVALSSALVGQKAPWPEFARLAARVGYGGADLNLGAAMREGLDATRALYQDNRLRASFCSIPIQFTATPEAFETAMKALPAAAQFASQVGCNRMMFVLTTSSATPKPELYKLLKERITAAAEILAKYNVRLGMEFLGVKQFRTRQPHEFIWKMSEAVAFARECGPNVGVTLDSWHWHHSESTVQDILDAGKSRIVLIHISDCDPKIAPDDVRDSPRMMPGEGGGVNLVGFLQALAQIGYEDGLSPEVIGRIPADMSAEDAAKLGLSTTLAVMKKAGVV